MADLDPGRRPCFVIGPIGNRHAAVGSPERSTYEEALEVYEKVIEPACEMEGLEPVRADGLTRAGDMTDQIFRRLRDDDVVIADLTGANPNVMYELGLRHTRDRITLQVGEYGRLPFDINVIRTVMFSRSEYGLISARDELRELLAAALAGEFDPVTSTRVFNEPGGSASTEALPSADSATEETDDRGFLDVLAEAEEQSDVFVEALERMSGRLGEMGKLADTASSRIADSDLRGLGMRGRLAVTAEYAHELEKVAGGLESDVSAYVDAATLFFDGIDVLLARIEEDPSQLDEGDALEFATSIRTLAATTREAMASQGGLVASIKENAKISRVLREPSNRITAALGRFEAITPRVDDWDRRLQALGVPLPPDPPDELEDGGDSGDNTEDEQDH
jgi:hypothetical protein